MEQKLKPGYEINNKHMHNSIRLYFTLLYMFVHENEVLYILILYKWYS